MARKKTWGGRRPGSGRPTTLRDRVTVALTLDRRHVEILDRYKSLVDASSRSEAVRLLLDELDEKRP